MNLHGKREVNQTDATISFRDKTNKKRFKKEYYTKVCP